MDKLDINPLISIIVPIYNVEPYLRKCIDSIINQTYKNLEIILVDDGSPDNCGSICDEYAKTDSRIKVIHKVNGGLSDARNAGLRIATGEWITFVDSDDWLENNALEQMLNLANSNHADLIIGSTQKINDADNSIVWVDSSDTECQIMNSTQAMCDFFLNGCASWARLYKANIHKDVLFPVGEINEDEAIVLTILEKCTKIIRTPTIVYNYRYRAQSITTSSFSIKKLDWCKHCKQNSDYITNKYPDLIPLARKRYISSLMWALNNMTYDTKKFKIPIKKIRHELKNNFCFLNNFSFKEKSRALLLVYFYYIYAFFAKILKKHYS